MGLFWWLILGFCYERIRFMTSKRVKLKFLFPFFCFHFGLKDIWLSFFKTLIPLNCLMKCSVIMFLILQLDYFCVFQPFICDLGLLSSLYYRILLFLSITQTHTHIHFFSVEFNFGSVQLIEFFNSGFIQKQFLWQCWRSKRFCEIIRHLL